MKKLMIAMLLAVSGNLQASEDTDVIEYHESRISCNQVFVTDAGQQKENLFDLALFDFERTETNDPIFLSEEVEMGLIWIKGQFSLTITKPATGVTAELALPNTTPAHELRLGGFYDQDTHITCYFTPDF